MKALSEQEEKREYLREITDRFAGIKLTDFDPVSTWFSYGSNLLKQDFERKMIDHGSYLSLMRARRGSLEGWKRSLDNRSTTRGLAYSIRKGRRSFVDGIMHDVPVGDLPAYLRFEGVLDGNYHLKKDEAGRRYDIEAVKVRLLSGRETETCLTLVGRCTMSEESERRKRASDHRDDLTRYIRTSIKGAVDFGIDITPFQKDLQWLEKSE